MNKLFLFDVDSTLINEEVIDLIAVHAGVQAEVKSITDRAMAGELDFKKSLLSRVQLLKGLPIKVLEDVRGQITLTKGARELILEIKKAGDVIAVVSGGFLEVITPLMDELGIEYFRANSLEVQSGILTGAIAGEIIDRKAKADYLKQLALQFHPSTTYAIGDGANDIDMVKQSDVGIAFCAKAALNAVADHVITNRDLREILKYI